MEKKKREEGINSLIALLILTPILFAITIFLVISSFNNPNEASIVFSIVCGLMSIICAVALFEYSFWNEYIRDYEYVIFEFESWDYHSKSYKTYYNYGVSEVRAKYIFFKQVDSYISEYTEQDLIDYYNKESYLNYEKTYYHSEEKIMKKIYSEISDQIKREEKNRNVKIRAVNKINTFSIEELKDKIKEKEK